VRRPFRKALIEICSSSCGRRHVPSTLGDKCQEASQQSGEVFIPQISSYIITLRILLKTLPYQQKHHHYHFWGKQFSPLGVVVSISVIKDRTTTLDKSPRHIDSAYQSIANMGVFNSLDHIQGKTLYKIMSAACGSAFMLYGWDAGMSLSASLPNHCGLG